MMTTDLSPAFSAGHERGVASASWVEISDVDSARAVIAGLEDGDPEVLDLQPSPLSGEWAGESVPELSTEYGIDLSDDAVAEEFEAGFADGFWAELQRRATAMLPTIDVDAVLTGYAECAVWSSSYWGETPDAEPVPLDEAGFSVSDLSASALEEMRADVVSFVKSNAVDLAEMTPGQIGHDFWLTRNGHGAGFWDRGLGALGDRLSRAARAYGSSDLLANVDGEIDVV